MQICKLRSIGNTRVQCLGVQCAQYDAKAKTCMLNQIEKAIEEKQKRISKILKKQK